MNDSSLRSRISRAVTALVVCTWITSADAADYQTTVLQDKPVGYWRLGETSGSTVTNLGSLGAAGNGVASATVTFGQPGAITGDANTSAGFDGTSAKIEVPYSDQLNPTNFTFEVWANVTPGSSGVYRSPMASRDDTPAGNTAGVIFYAEPGDTWQFWTGKGDETGWHIIAGPGVQNDVWAHLVGVYDGTNKSFYVNGTLAGTTQVAFAPDDETVLRIGAGSSETDGNFFFEGDVDEVSFYNKALSEDRILAHYVAGFPQTTPPSITVQPKSTVVPPGATVTFTVSATGGLPLSYQWKLNNAAIPGATGLSLTVTNVQTATAGSYTVVVTNPGGTATSDIAKLDLPTPATKSYVDTVKGDGPVSYWRLDETSGDVAHDSVGQNNGTYLNSVTLGVPGAIIGDTNTAVGFESSSQQKVDVPYSPALNTPPFTVELWAKVTGGTSYRSPLTSRADNPQRGYIFYADPANTW